MSDMPNMPAPDVDPAPELPVFDFGNLSWDEAKEAAVLQQEVANAATANDPDKLKEAFSRIQDYIAITLVTVPRSWVVKKAPADIDWSIGASLGWLRADKFNPMIDAWQNARSFGNASGG